MTERTPLQEATPPPLSGEGSVGDMVLVPREATEAMIRAGDWDHPNSDPQRFWRAMLAAAPRVRDENA